jgi:hypothetical protein
MGIRDIHRKKNICDIASYILHWEKNYKSHSAEVSLKDGSNGGICTHQVTRRK